MLTVTIELPDEVEELARQRGLSVSEWTRQAVDRLVAEALEDEEDEKLALDALRRIESGRERTYSHEEVWGDLDALPDRV